MYVGMACYGVSVGDGCVLTSHEVRSENKLNFRTNYNYISSRI